MNLHRVQAHRHGLCRVFIHSIYLKRRRGNTTSIETPVIAHEGMNVK